jgi:hypothetical protein
VSTPTSIISAIRHCLRPLVRLCLRFGLDYRGLTEILKVQFILVGEEEIARSGHAASDSRVSLLTGVHRKDVKRLRGADVNDAELHKRPLSANLISYWIGTPSLLDVEGNPVAIPRSPTPGFSTSFEEVARTLTKDVHPRALLDECARQGIVRLDHEDMVHLNTDVLIPDQSLDDKAGFFAHAIHDHIAASGHNLAGGTPAYLDRHVWYVDLTEADAIKLAAISEKIAMKALKAVNQHALELKQASEENPESHNTRITFGTYFYNTREADD